MEECLHDVEQAAYHPHKADVYKRQELTSWELLGHWYSRDARRVYYLNREIKGADRDSFTVCTPVDAALLVDHLARDKDHFYQNDEIMEETLWLEQLCKMTQEP